MHDYSDDDCIRILKQLAPAMDHDSVVLVSEMVLPARITPENFPAAIMDATMMITGGKERTEEMYKRVFEASGLQLNKVYRASAGSGSLVEARLATK